MLSVFMMRVFVHSVIRPAIVISVVIPFVVAPTLGFKLQQVSKKVMALENSV